DSRSTLVRMPSACIPRNRASPDTPEPVPISTTARASKARASRVSMLAPPRPIGITPSDSAAAREAAASSASGTKSSAHAQDAGEGALLADVAACGFTIPNIRPTARHVGQAQREPVADGCRGELRFRHAEYGSDTALRPTAD